jgi:V/A-type H+-transporting ATPase subunit I
MAIVRMNKFTLIAFEASKKDILKKLQSFGEIEFINLQSKRLSKEDETLNSLKEDVFDPSFKETEETLSDLKSAINFLKNYIEKESTLKSLKEGKPSLSYDELKEYGKEENFKEFLSFLKAKEERLNEIDSLISKINTDYEILFPWKNLDLSFSDLEDFKKVNYFLGTIPTSREDDFKHQIEENCKYVHLEIVNRDTKLSYILLFVHKDEMSSLESLLKLLEFNEFKPEFDEKPILLIEGFKEQLNNLKEEKRSIIEDLKEMKNELLNLEKAHEYFENKLIRLKSSENFLKSDKTILISGYFPEEKRNIFENYIKSLPSDNYYYKISDVSDEDIDEIPIKLKNGTIVKSFESITEMYSLPKYDGIDPTPLLTPFYMIFFGMMVADFAYGVIVFAAALFALKKFNLNEKSQNFVRMFMYLGITTAIWGLIYGSVFGDVIKIPALIDTSRDIYTVVFLSIGFGAIQVLFGLCIKGYMLIKKGDPWGAFFDSGSWIITLVSIGLLAAGFSFAKYTMIAGMVLIVLTNGRDAKSVAGKLASGAYALYGITGYIGDLVSYTRLMALGISGGSIAGALNLIIGSFPGISLFIVGPVLFIAVHIFNMLLGLLGAYVHGLRLQYVEFFGKFYSGGGRPFSPFKMVNKYINIKN